MNPYWICVQFSAQNAHWICGHLKLLKIRHKSFLHLCTIFPHESLLNLLASRAVKIRHKYLLNLCTFFSQKSLLKCVDNFFRINPYWICSHLKLVNNRHECWMNLCTIFPHQSLLNLLASKASQIRHESWLKSVYKFSAQILTGFAGI